MHITLYAEKKRMWSHDKESVKNIIDNNESLGSITHAVLFLLLLLGMFDGLLEHIFSTFPVTAAGFFIAAALVFHDRFKLRQGWSLMFCSYIGITLVSYLFLVNDFHYDLITSIKNSVIMAMNAARNIMLLSFFADKKMDRKTVHIIGFFFLIEAVMYIIYAIYRGKGGVFEKALVDLKLVRDWQGRFQGTFAEPMTMGFYLGIMIFFVLIYFDSKWKYFLSAVLTAVLFTACKAKFALIAVPFALLTTVLTEKRFKIKNLGKFFGAAVMLAFIAMVFLAWMNSSFIFSVIAENFGTNASFGDRFYFLAASLRQIVLFPLGTGYGLNFEYYYKTVSSLLPVLEQCGLDSVEIRDAMAAGHQIGMNGKETISHVICVYGIPGIIRYFSCFAKYVGMNVRRKHYIRGLIIFILIEGSITIDFLMGYCMPFVLLAMMLVNSCKIEPEQEKQYKKIRLGG